MEREYLRLLADPRKGSVATEARFPNPVYRRKLQWSVRRKAARAFEDWNLLARAAQREPRLVTVAEEPSESVPLYSEPIARLIGRLGRALRHGPRGPEEAPPARGR